MVNGGSIISTIALGLSSVGLLLQSWEPIAPVSVTTPATGLRGGKTLECATCPVTLDPSPVYIRIACFSGFILGLLVCCSYRGRVPVSVERPLPVAPPRLQDFGLALENGPIVQRELQVPDALPATSRRLIRRAKLDF